VNITETALLRSRSWRALLEELVQGHDLWAAVLTDFQGLPFAASVHADWSRTLEPGQRQYLIDILAAFAPPFLRTGQQLESYVGDFKTDEITMRTMQGARIVSRLIPRVEEDLILTVLVPPRRPYRRAMNNTIRELLQLP